MYEKQERESNREINMVRGKERDRTRVQNRVRM